MKKFTYVFILPMLIIALAACNTNDKYSPDAQNLKEGPFVEGVKDVDVLNTYRGIVGFERMQDFYDTIQKGIASDIRIVHYTIEGDPIVTDLTFNGESLEVEHDGWGAGQGSGGTTTNSCGNLIEESTPTNITYIATDCSDIPNGEDEVLQINFNMSEQDLFELEMKYGTELENEINTVTNKAIKEISATETQVMSDFDLSASVMQEVYKRLVFANFLAEKDLEATCKNGDAMNYNLTVHLNGGQAEYRWTECDQGLDGATMTDIAEYIIEESEKVTK